MAWDPEARARRRGGGGEPLRDVEGNAVANLRTFQGRPSAGMLDAPPPMDGGGSPGHAAYYSPGPRGGDGASAPQAMMMTPYGGLQVAVPLPSGRDGSPSPGGYGGGGGPISPSGLSPTGRSRFTYGAAMADLRPGPSEDQRRQAEAQRRQLLADLEEQVRAKKEAAARKAAKEEALRAREEAEIREYHRRLQADREAELAARRAQEAGTAGVSPGGSPVAAAGVGVGGAKPDVRPVGISSVGGLGSSPGGGYLGSSIPPPMATQQQFGHQTSEDYMASSSVPAGALDSDPSQRVGRPRIIPGRKRNVVDASWLDDIAATTGLAGAAGKAPPAVQQQHQAASLPLPTTVWIRLDDGSLVLAPPEQQLQHQQAGSRNVSPARQQQQQQQGPAEGAGGGGGSAKEEVTSLLHALHEEQQRLRHEFQAQAEVIEKVIQGSAAKAARDQGAAWQDVGRVRAGLMTGSLEGGSSLSPFVVESVLVPANVNFIPEELSPPRQRPAPGQQHPLSQSQQELPPLPLSEVIDGLDSSLLRSGRQDTPSRIPAPPPVAHASRPTPPQPRTVAQRLAAEDVSATPGAGSRHQQHHRRGVGSPPIVGPHAGGGTSSVGRPTPQSSGRRDRVADLPAPQPQRKQRVGELLKRTGARPPSSQQAAPPSPYAAGTPVY